MGKIKKDDHMSNIYNRMNDTGKKKLVQISEQFLHIWNTVHEEKIPEIKKDINNEFKNI
jgi:hypothetical protein